MVSGWMSEQNKPTSDAKEALERVTADRMTLREDAFHVIRMVVDGETYEDIRPVMLFPLSSKANHVSVLDDDGKEICMLVDPEHLDKESRDVLARAFDAMYYMPKIIRIDGIEETAGVSRWETQTDCGYAVFEIAVREKIRRLSGGRYILQDADGNRFEIEDVNALDPRSLSLFQSET
jgi:Domain of unknown function (DUF1854)